MRCTHLLFVRMFGACLAAFQLHAAEFHVSLNGNDANSGSAFSTLRTISEAARRAQPGDTVTVHEGVYRERINPPRGGSSENARITYQAAPGEAVVIKGSEIVTGWQFVGNDTWKVTLPSSFFGAFNPFNNLLAADWLDSNAIGRHTAAIYLNGDWLLETTAKSTVLQPASGTPQWYAEVDGGGYLFNVASFQPYLGATAGTKVDASWFDRGFGVIIENCSEGSQDVGWIEDGDWTRYSNVDFGSGSDSISIRTASATIGGRIEVRLDKADGPLLGTCIVPATGGWQTWQNSQVNIVPTNGLRTVCLVYRYPATSSGNTTIWAQFPGKDPNSEFVEINARQSVFYPEETGNSYITVRGFTLEQAATPWVPPTAEQIGLLGPHWSKGWIIEDNTIRYSTCSGISLGKYGDRWDNTAIASGNATGVEVQAVQRALDHGWNKQTVGSHIVRRNHISHCEQSGIVGHLGAVFSTISDNSIHDVQVIRAYTGQETAGIKIHGAVDCLIANNHIHHCIRGLWLDWMAQGTRITGNLFHDNAVTEDVFVEVSHGPTLFDHNVLLSGKAITDCMQGGAFVHNLIAGAVAFTPDNNRYTPYLQPHDTPIAGLEKVTGGDTRYYNNIVVGASLSVYDNAVRPTPMSGNVFLKGATASTRETSPLVLSSYDPAIQLKGGDVGYYLKVTVDPAWATSRTRSLVTTALLDKAQVPNVAFEQPDGSPWTLDTDFLGDTHNLVNPFPGPFQSGAAGTSLWKVSTDPTAPAAPGPQVMERIHVDINGAQTTGTAGDFSGTPATILGQAGETWNYVTPGNKTSGSATAIKNAANGASTVGLAWTANYYSYDNSSAAAPYRDLLGDYAYVYNGGGGPASSTWTFSGLSPNGIYNLIIYTANNTAGGRWTVNGTTKDGIPNGSAASLNEGQQYVRFTNVRPSSSGQISIDFAIRSGQSYGEMAGLELETVGFVTPGAASLASSGFNGAAFQLTPTGLDPSRRYVLTRSSNLNDGFPKVIGNPFYGNVSVLSDPAPPTDKAFYRIEEVP